MANANLTCPEPLPHSCWNLPPLPRSPWRCGSQLLLAATLCSLGSGAFADLPLSVESILTDKGKTKLNLSLSYRNQGMAEVFSNDTVGGSATLRYGLTDKTEIFVRGSGQYSNSRSITDTKSDVRFLSTWAGASYKFKKDTETPALIGFVEGALVERGNDSTYTLKSWAAGLTAYKSIDPIVFVFSGHYGLNLPRKDGEVTIDPGNTWLLNPSVAFAVNDRVTLNAGVVWTNRWPWHTANEDEEQDSQDSPTKATTRPFRETNTDLQFGVDYGFSDDNILNVTFLSNVSGTRGASLKFDWVHTF